MSPGYPFAVANVVVPLLFLAAAAAIILLVSDWSEFGDVAIRRVRCARVGAVIAVLAFVALVVYAFLRYGFPVY